jgi:DNA polymerase V
MGAPAFKYRQLFKEQGVMQFSANFELYGDISDRITRLLTHITPRTEVYSVDESFLDLSELELPDYQQWASGLRQHLLKNIGIPVSIGIGTTKTLAKLAAEHAKRDSGASGILDLVRTPQSTLQNYLLNTPISDVWGVGRRLAPRLRAEGVHNALGLSNMPPRLASQLMGVHGRQMVAELNGIRCHQLEPFGKIRQTIMHGRQFGEDTNQFVVIESAIASLTARATASLRTERLLARSAMLSLSTNRHKPGYQRTSRVIDFQTPTADSGHITRQLVAAAEVAFNPRAWYHKANILLYNLINEQSLQTDLFNNLDLGLVEASRERLQAFDAINRRYGRQTIHYAAEDLSQAWQPKRQLRSHRYTTNWQELPTARITN